MHSPQADHQQADVLREIRTYSVPTTQHCAAVCVAAKALHPTVLPQKSCNQQCAETSPWKHTESFFCEHAETPLGKPVTSLKPDHAAAPCRWSDFIATDADELAANASFAGHTWHSVPGGIGDTDEDACLITSLD